MSRFVLAGFVALAVAAGGSAQDPVGKWSGYWVSDATGHTGPIHARVRQLDGGEYRATFRGRFAKVVPFWYPATLTVESAGGGAVVLGTHRRLPIFGEYRMTAVVTAAGFDAGYAARGDSGRFVLTRRP